MRRLLYPGDRALSSHCIGGWLGPGAGKEAVGKRKISCPCRKPNPCCPARNPSLYPLSYCWTIVKNELEGMWKEEGASYLRYSWHSRGRTISPRIFGVPAMFITEHFQKLMSDQNGCHPSHLALLGILSRTILSLFIPFLAPTGVWGIHETSRFISVS
jgi:hypothetical protein